MSIKNIFKRVFVTGAAGFVGSHCVDYLLGEGVKVIGWDNLSTGQVSFLDTARNNPDFKFIKGDNLNLEELCKGMDDCDAVFHFAANADVRFGLENSRRDLEQNTIATHNVLEAMRRCGIKVIIFSSTGSVYGEAITIPTSEDCEFPIQTSLYGASKLACEGMISAYCGGFGIRGYIFRFVSIIGERYSHGHIFDFYKQLRENSDILRILGNGTQRKSYLCVDDCIEGIGHILNFHEFGEDRGGVKIYNLGSEQCITVNDSVGIICNELGVSPKLLYSGGDRGWVGDNPYIFLDSIKARKTGWTNDCSISDGICRTVRWLKNNEWIYNTR